LKENPNDTKNYCLFALGSRDKSLSIWLTSEQRPLTVLYDIFDSPIMDITWSKETISLLCCSMDGTVLFINFDNLEIGYPLNKQENEIFFKLKYSYDLNSIPIISNKRQEVERGEEEEEEEKKIRNNLKFIENIEVLNLQEKEKEEKITFILSDSNSNSSQLKNEVNFPHFNSFLIFSFNY
jgi:WD40 repeat protein